MSAVCLLPPSDFRELVDEHCRAANIHIVCYTCLRVCKGRYTPWFGLLPETEYCDKHDPAPLWTYIIENITEAETP